MTGELYDWKQEGEWQAPDPSGRLSELEESAKEQGVEAGGGQAEKSGQDYLEQRKEDLPHKKYQPLWLKASLAMAGMGVLTMPAAIANNHPEISIGISLTGGGIMLAGSAYELGVSVKEMIKSRKEGKPKEDEHE